MTLRELRDNNPVPGCITQPGHTLLTDCTGGHIHKRSPTPASYISVFSAYYVLVIYLSNCLYAQKDKKNEINLFKYQPEVIKLASGVQINLHICLENVML